MNPFRAALPIAALLLAGCAGGDAPARLTAAIDTVNGVERVTYPAQTAGDLPWALDTVAVLGDAFAEDAYQFDRVASSGLASDAAGNLYVLDRQGSRVLKYGPDGEHLATFGRQGEGPGELSQPLAVAVGRDDTVWVSDFSNRRFTGYPQDGGDPRTIAFGEAAGIPGAMAAADAGFIATFRQLFMFNRGAGGGMNMSRGDGGEGAERTVPVLRLDRSLQPLDTLWQSPEPPMDMVQLEAGGAIMVTMMAREFWPQFLWDDLGHGGMALVDSASYAIHLLDAAGGPVRVIARDPAPRAATEADRELARQRVRDEAGQGGGVRIGGGPSEDMQEEILRQRLEKMTFADVIPRIVALRVDPADRIWVGVSGDTPGEVARIDVYDADGTLLGELRDFPFPDVFLGPDRIGVLRRDELDVQQIVLMEVRRRPRS